MREDMGLFARSMFQHQFKLAIPPFHDLIYRLLLSKERRFKSIVAPRGFAKSSVVSFANPMHRISFKTQEEPEFIIIVSEAQDQAINFLAGIRNALKYNQVYHHFFGKRLEGPGTKDTDKDIVTNNLCRVKAMGTGQKIRGQQYMGSRPTLIILDDFESELNTETEAMRTKNSDWVAGAVEHGLNRSRGELHLVGTIVHYAAYLQTTLRDPAFEHLFFQALNTNADGSLGKLSLWPEMFPTREIMAHKESLEARGKGHVWWREYMNVPTSPDERSFPPECIMEWDGDIVNDNGSTYVQINEINGKSVDTAKPVACYVGCDPAISSRGDFTVITPVGMDSSGNIYVESLVRRRMQPDEIIEDLFRMYHRYRPLITTIEEVAYQQALQTFFLKEQVRRNIFVAVAGEPPRGPKNKRIESMSPMVKARKLYLKKNGCEPLKREMTEWPTPTTDDCMDSLYYATLKASPYLGGNFLEPPERQRQPAHRVSSGNWRLW